MTPLSEPNEQAYVTYQMLLNQTRLSFYVNKYIQKAYFL